MSMELSGAESLKFDLLCEGLRIEDDAQRYIDERNGGRALTPADYASTSGVILELDGDVWVNAPIADFNANFVSDPRFALRLDEDGLCVAGASEDVRARFWLPPLYHGEASTAAEPFTSFAFTHADRVRVSPIEGCSMTCKFCNLPYEFRYTTKRIEGVVEAMQAAATDPVQPASHVLISGGTPREADYGYVRDVYEAVITGFPELPVDIMMVPIAEVMDVAWLDHLGVNELSINIEVFDRELAPIIMRRKAAQGLDLYLSFMASAAEQLGPRRVRSMVLVGLEELDQTLAAVTAIAERGCVPVLSPFRPDPKTPLRDQVPPTADFLRTAFIRSQEIARAHDVPLGPTCIPCSHNTLTLATSGAGDADHHHGRPNLI